MEIDLSGKKALVTGAAQGIGLAVVKKLVSCGAEVVALDIKGEQMKEALKELPGIETFEVDLSNWESTLETLKNVGQVQLVANVAGVCIPKEKLELSEIDRILDVNLKGVMAVCKHVVNDWSSSGVSGAIVNIASGAAVRPCPPHPTYCASKAAVLQFSRCLALEYAPKGIRVNVVSPGVVLTDMTRPIVEDPELAPVYEKMVPMQEKLIDAEDIANSVAFLLCDKVARKITGANLFVDAGFMLT